MTLKRFLSGSSIKLLEVALLQAPMKRLCPDCGSSMECLMVTFVVGNSGEPWSLPVPCCFRCVPAPEAAESTQTEEAVASVEILEGNADRSAELGRGARKHRPRYNGRRAG